MRLRLKRCDSDWWRCQWYVHLLLIWSGVWWDTVPKVQQTRESHEGPGVDRLIFTSAQQKQEQYHQLCLIILQIKSGEGGHIIGLRNLNWNLRKWNASVTSASHLMQRPTWRWRRWWRWPGWWWAKKRWWSYTDFCFVPCTLRRLANEQGVSYSDYVISSNLARS